LPHAFLCLVEITVLSRQITDLLRRIKLGPRFWTECGSIDSFFRPRGSRATGHRRYRRGQFVHPHGHASQPSKSEPRGNSGACPSSEDLRTLPNSMSLALLHRLLVPFRSKSFVIYRSTLAELVPLLETVVQMNWKHTLPRKLMLEFLDLQHPCMVLDGCSGKIGRRNSAANARDRAFDSIFCRLACS
jgi:hypothetical protein